MARIPEADIERLKQEVSLQRLVEAQGIELKRHGADLLGLCPFHEDHEPSLVVSLKKNLWHCLGACQAGGSVIDWVMRSRGVSFRHAVELLRNEHPSLAEPVRIVSKGTTEAVKLETPFEVNAGDQRVLRQVVDYYHEMLQQSPEALKYLQGRGLTHPEMIGHFRIGFSNRTLGYRLPEKNRKAGEEIRGRLQKLGILRESGHEHFNGSVVIPVFDLNGNITEMYGRKITPGLREGTPLHLYLPGPHQGVWNELALQVSKEIILCESLIDALTFWCAGFRNVTASYGVGGFTEDHKAAFKRHGVQRVWIAYDRDEAGDKAALALAEELMAIGIECFRVLFPHGMDANEHARKTKPAARVLEIVGVKLDSGREVSFNLKENRHLDYGYAVTSHSSQGATADRVLVNVDTEEAHANLINSRLAYVAVSRARYDAQIYTNDAGNLGKALSREVSHAAAVNGQQEENALVSGETGATGYGENSAANHSQASQHDQGHDMAMEA